MPCRGFEPATKAELERNFDSYRAASLTLRAWAMRPDVDLADAGRLVMGTSQRLPTHVTVPDVDSAAWAWAGKALGEGLGAGVVIDYKIDKLATVLSEGPAR